MTGQIIDGDKVRIILPGKAWLALIGVLIGLGSTTGTLYYRFDKRLQALEQYREEHTRDVDFRWSLLMNGQDELKRSIDGLRQNNHK